MSTRPEKAGPRSFGGYTLLLASLLLPPAPDLVGQGAAPKRGTDMAAAGDGLVPYYARDLVPDVQGLLVSGQDTTRSQGAGILLGSSGDSIYLITARHVVYRGGGPIAYPILRVRFGWIPGRSFGADVVRDDSEMDIAVLAVRLPGGSIGVKMNRLAEGGKLRPGDPVRPVGCPNSLCWNTGPTDLVVGLDPARTDISFLSSVVTGGSSGGALFNDEWEVVGLVLRNINRSLSRAVAIEAVVRRVEEWRVPVGIKKPFVPRKGYRWSVGVSALAPASPDAFPSDRLPGGRANVLYQVHPLVELHVGAIRLTPVDISVTGGLAGVGLTLKYGRVMLNPFVEGGFAHVEGRFDAGGYFVEGNGDGDYIPFYNRLEDDVLGFGAALAIQALILPRVVLEMYAGHWNFNLPEPLGSPGSAPPAALFAPPDWPELFVGAGLRLGL